MTIPEIIAKINAYQELIEELQEKKNILIEELAKENAKAKP